MNLNSRKLLTSLAVWTLVAFNSSIASAYRLIEALPTDGTTCEGYAVTCNTNDTITRWFVHTVPFWVNADAESDAADPHLTQADIIGAAEASYQAWEDVPFSFIKFDYQGTTSNRIAADRISTTLFYNSTHDSGYCVGAFGAPGGTLAIAILTQDLPLGEITDADIVVDSADTWEWSTACTDNDIQSLLTHEYGHSVGIHHTEVNTGNDTTQPTMYAYYNCDPGVASMRSLELDDEEALQCLYPDQPTVILMDQTGSMSVDSRMADAQASANSFITDMADNLMSVAAFADCSWCSPARDGYDLLEDWTDWAADLQLAVNSTSANGNTPLWESTCCAIGKAMEMEPGNVLVFTDTEENWSDDSCSADCPIGYCGCTKDTDVVDELIGRDIVVYVIDITEYAGTLLATATTEAGNEQDFWCYQRPANSDGDALWEIANLSGGLYCSARDEKELHLARLAIQRHMGIYGREHQNPSDCDPKLPIDDIQVYGPDGKPDSPYIGKEVEIIGKVTVPAKTYDLYTHYIEDCTGGIQARISLNSQLKPGDVVRVSGEVQDYLGELRLTRVGEVELLSSEEPLEAPIISPGDALNYEAVGHFTRVSGYVLNKVENYRFLLSPNPNDQRGTITVFIDPDTGIDPDMFKPGRQFIISGVVSKRNTQNELKPRHEKDIVGL